MTPETTDQTAEQILLIQPENLIGDDNIRFALIPARIDTMAEDIMQQGGVQTPLIAEPTEAEGIYKIRDGHYRQAACIKLNRDGAGLLCPVIVRQSADSLHRLKSQLSANLERQDMTPMDKAVAMRKLLESGVPRVDIRNIFRTVGGRKGQRNQPLSNSMLNITMSFLELPKSVQQKIHEGSLGIAAAYELTKAPPEKQKAILERAEAELTAQRLREDKEEAKFLDEERKAAEQEQKAKQTEEQLLKLKAAKEAAEEEVKAKADAEAEAYKLSRKAAKDSEDKALLQKALKDAEKARQDAEMAAKKIGKEMEKIEEVKQSAAAKAQERAKKLAELRKQAEKDARAKKGVTPSGITKAAKAEGVSTDAKPLSAVEMRRYVDEWALDGGYPKALTIGKAIKDAFSGRPGCLTSQQVFSVILKATGESVQQQKVKKTA